MVSARVVVAAAAVAFTAGCGVIAGLPSDYQLADASTGDDATTGTDAKGTSDGSHADGATDAATGDAGAVDAAFDSAPDSATMVDASEAAPTVPPSDPGNVACGAIKCPLPGKICCEAQATTSCVDRLNPQCSGITAECDEAANCGFNQRCCVTGTQTNGLETRCSANCGGGDPQACRTNAECPTGQACVAWSCAGHVVATCNGVGADAGCH